MAHVLWFVPLLLFILLIPIIGILFLVLLFYCLYLVTAIPFYTIARNCDFDSPWIVFLPACKNYIAFTLPFDEFKLGFFKTKHRKLIFWLWFLCEPFMLTAFGLLGLILFIASFYRYLFSTSPTGNSLLSDTFSVGCFIIISIVFLILFALRSVVHWRKNYDLLNAYGLYKHASWAPLVNIICPLVMVILSYSIMHETPIRGGWGFYRENAGVCYH